MIAVIFICAAALGDLPGAEDYLAGLEAEQGRYYANAIAAYRKCAEEDEDLAPYAEIGLAGCLTRSGQAGDAEAALRELLKRRPSGPWVRMAQTCLAQWLAKDKRYGEAAELFRNALDVPVQPWWMDRYAWAAGDNLLADKNTRPQGYAFFRDLVDTTLYLGPRRDAAQRLLASPDPSDRPLAILGLLRAGMYQDAGKALLASPGTVLDATGATLPAADVAKRLFQAWPEDEAARAELDTWVQANADNLWMRLWLVYAMRRQANDKKITDAQGLCALLVKYFPTTREAGEGLWWLARHFEREDKKEPAADFFQQLARDCPVHYRADDALLKAAYWRFQAGETDQAEGLFQHLAQDYPDSPFRSQAYYMGARIRSKAGDGKNAHLDYLHAVESGVGNYYAHRALDRLGGVLVSTGPASHNLKIDGKNPVLRPFPGMGEPVEPIPEAILTEPRVKRLLFFGAHGLEAGEWEALHLCESLKDCETPGSYFRVLAETGYLHMALPYADSLGWGLKGKAGDPPLTGDTRTHERLRFEFPLAHWPSISAIAREAGVDPFLLLAIAKAESTFRARIFSPAGAQGLMQVMPATAHWLAKIEPNVTAAHLRDTLSPQNSLRLGAYYLLRMIDGSDANLVYALASYNAGPGNCRKWRKRFPDYDIDRFVEAIPFGETQQYVTQVLGHYAAYYSLYPPAAEAKAAQE